MLVALNGLKYATELGAVLKQSPGSDSSYAKHIDSVHQWIEQSFNPPGWQGEFLTTCRKMLDSNRNARPSAEVVLHAWSSLQCPDTSMICKCSGDETLTLADRIIDACKTGSEDVERLLEECIEPVLEAIHFAAAHGSSVIVQALLNTGIDVDTPNPVGQTALPCASRNGAADVVKLLLSKGANVNARDENEQTALHGAAAQGYENIVRMLLDAKADFLTEDLDGQTALQFATRSCHISLEELLQEHSTS